MRSVYTYVTYRFSSGAIPAHTPKQNGRVVDTCLLSFYFYRLSTSLQLDISAKAIHTKANSQLSLLLHIQLPSRPHGTTINRNRRTINVRARSTRQIHHHTRNILRPSKSLHRVRRRDALLAAAHVQQAIAHLGREKARADTVHRDAPRSQLHSQVPPQVNHRRLGSAVPVRALLTNSADAQPRHGSGDDHAAGILDAGLLLQKGRKLADGVEHAPDVQVHDLGKGRVGMVVKGGTPRGAGVG